MPKAESYSLLPDVHAVAVALAATEENALDFSAENIADRSESYNQTHFKTPKKKLRTMRTRALTDVMFSGIETFFSCSGSSSSKDSASSLPSSLTFLLKESNGDGQTLA